MGDGPPWERNHGLSSAMAGRVTALIFLMLQQCSADVSSSPDPDALAMTARAYLDNLQQHLGKSLTKDMIKPFQEQSDALIELEKAPGPDLITQVRAFVKVVGPMLDKPAYADDAPLHEVLIRADYLLGLADDADQDAHPYVKGRVISQAIRAFTEQLVIAFNRRAKDEL